jgi:hypothetical protein
MYNAVVMGFDMNEYLSKYSAGAMVMMARLPPAAQPERSRSLTELHGACGWPEPGAAVAPARGTELPAARVAGCNCGNASGPRDSSGSSANSTRMLGCDADLHCTWVTSHFLTNSPTVNRAAARCSWI